MSRNFTLWRHGSGLQCRGLPGKTGVWQRRLPGVVAVSLQHGSGADDAIMLVAFVAVLALIYVLSRRASLEDSDSDDSLEEKSPPLIDPDDS